MKPASRGSELENWVSEYLHVIKQRLGLSTDAELANELGFGKSTFATWRRRGEIPDAALVRLADRVGHDLTTGDELLFALAVSQSAMLLRALYTYVVMVRRHEIEVGDRDDFTDLLWWSGMRGPIERLLLPIIKEKAKANFKAGEVYAELREEIDADRLASVTEIIDLWEKGQDDG